MLPPECKGCPRAPHAQAFIPPDKIGPATKLIVWGEMAGADEARAGRGFVGISGRKLRQLMRRLGLKMWSAWPNDPQPPYEEVACTNVVLCRGGDNRFPGFEVARECLTRHQTGPSTLSAVTVGGSTKPNNSLWTIPWLACGANAIEALTSFRLPILRTRGSLLPSIDGTKWVVGTIHPAFLVRGAEGKGMEELDPVIAIDANRALTGGVPQAPPMQIFAHPLDVNREFQRDKPAEFSLDIEGSDGKPKLVGVAWRVGRKLTTRVMSWNGGVRTGLAGMLQASTPILHNASFDIPELQEAGVEIPENFHWVDTINLAALYNPGFLKNLQTQVLTLVGGSVAWKGLINHDKGPSWTGKQKKDVPVSEYRRLWGTVLKRLGRPVPHNADEWFSFYNGLDVSWTLLLYENVKQALSQQGRYSYYTEVMEPLQVPLVTMGLEGMPFDKGRLGVHRKACRRLRRMADGIVQSEGEAMLSAWLADENATITELEAEREAERASGQRKFSRAKELSRVRTHIRTLNDHLTTGFSIDSPKQKALLLSSWLGLPLPKTDKGNVTTKDDVLENLLKRMSRVDEYGKPCPTVKPKRGSLEEGTRIVRAIVAGTKWTHWEKTFLNPPIKETS